MKCLSFHWLPSLKLLWFQVLKMFIRGHFYGVHGRLFSFGLQLSSTHVKWKMALSLWYLSETSLRFLGGSLNALDDLVGTSYCFEFHGAIT